MKKQIVSSITLIMIAFLWGLTGRSLATNIQTPKVESNSSGYVNDINNQLQNMASKQQSKDMRRQVVVMMIIIVTVLLIVGLITWYYMTNQ